MMGIKPESAVEPGMLQKREWNNKIVEQARNKDEVIICAGQEWQARWDDFVGKASGTSLSHLSCWQSIIAQTYGHRTFYLMHCREIEILGVLPLVWLRWSLFGNALCSMPFLDYGGICTADETSGKTLFTKAMALRDSCKAQYLELRHENPTRYGGALRQDKVDMILDLSPGQDLIWNSLAPKVRNQVRKASKSGLTTHIGGEEFLEDFYRVFAINMRDLGSPVHSPSFFANIFREFGKRAKIVLVCDGTKKVGALLCLFYKDSVFVPWASSLREYFPKCPNNLLYWDTIRCACEKYCNYFHFGRSSVGSGTYKFKQQWGARERILNWQFYYRQSAPIYTSMAENPKYHMAAQVWKRLPLSLTLLLGPHLRKYLTN
jgi:FemAB-related protein (PEP-CTERM system-associated)